MLRTPRTLERNALLPIESLEPRRLLASPQLLLDIEPGPGSSVPDETSALGELAIFAVGSEEFSVWASDGTSVGTVMIGRDLAATHFTPAAGLVFFWGRDAEFGWELRATDGTADGTRLVKDLHPGPADTGVYALGEAADIAYFAPPAPGIGVELWRSDGTEEGTRLLKDIVPGAGSASPTIPMLLGDSLIFSADDGEHGRELWISDGTEEGTRLLVDLVPGPEGSLALPLAVHGSTLFFTAVDERGRELWKSDGTPEGTQFVKDVNPGPGDSSIGPVASVGDVLLFRAFSADYGFEYWRTDGTPDGTQILKDIRPGPADGGVGGVVSNGSIAFLAADNGVEGRELWKTDGTTDGTVLVRDISPGSSNPHAFTFIGDTLYFAAEHPVYGTELWSSDGSLAGTQLVADINPGVESSNPNFLERVGTRLHFRADDGIHGVEPWVLETADDDGEDGEATIVDFENLPLGFIDSGVYEQDGFVFANVRGDGGAISDRLRVDGANQRYESQVLTTYNWARRLLVSRADGAPFSLDRFDYAAGRWNEPGDFVLTGRFADGSVETRAVSFSDRNLLTLELNWEDVLSFDLNAAGGANNAYFAVDNFVFNAPEEEGPSFLTGSLAALDPVDFGRDDRWYALTLDRTGLLDRLIDAGEENVATFFSYLAEPGR